MMMISMMAKCMKTTGHGDFEDEDRDGDDHDQEANNEIHDNSDVGGYKGHDYMSHVDIVRW